MAKAKNGAEAPEISPGLVRVGVLRGRRRRLVKMKDGTAPYCFALSLRWGDHVERVERWADESLPPDMAVVGATITLPVRVRLFTPVIGPQ